MKAQSPQFRGSAGRGRLARRMTVSAKTTANRARTTTNVTTRNMPIRRPLSSVWTVSGGECHADASHRDRLRAGARRVRRGGIARAAGARPDPDDPRGPADHDAERDPGTGWVRGVLAGSSVGPPAADSLISRSLQSVRNAGRDAPARDN